MEIKSWVGKQDRPLNIGALTDMIQTIQRFDGEIPWSSGDKTDPWDHVEAAMGLTVGGHLTAARKAYDWLAAIQLSDGSFYASYRSGQALDRTRDANLTAYVAVGVLHHYLACGDSGFLQSMWKTVAAAVDFALGLQTRHGDIHWAIDPDGNTDPMSLLTGSSSIFMSVKCALATARLLGEPKPAWEQANRRLAEAIANKPHRFNMTKSRFSMDWYYPILGGVITGQKAQKRMDRYWKKFVVEGLGVRCVSDRPWVTIAETCELSLALSAMGNREMARVVFQWIENRRFEDGTFWTGFTFPDMTVWPEEKLTWNNAVVLLAADALYDLTPAGRLFEHAFWRDNRIDDYKPAQ